MRRRGKGERHLRQSEKQMQGLKVVFVLWRDSFMEHRRKVMRVTHKGMTEQAQPSAHELVDTPPNTQRIMSHRQTPVHRIIMSNSLTHVCRIATPNRYKKKNHNPSHTQEHRNLK